MSLRSKLAVSFAFVALIPLAVLQQVVAGFVQQQFARQTSERFSVMCGLAGQHFTREAARLGDAVRSARTSYELIAALDAYEEEGRGAQFELIGVVEQLASTHGVSLLAIYDDAGTVLASAHEPSRFNVRDLQTIERAHAANGQAMFDRERGLEERGLVLRVCLPVEQARGRVWLAGGLRVDEHLLGELPLIESVALMVVDERNVLLAPTPGGRAAREILSEVRNPVLATAGALRGAGWDVETVRLPSIVDAERVEVLVALSRLPMEALLKWLERVSLLMVGAGMLVAWVLSYMLSRRWTAPIDQLVAAVDRVALGDLDARVGLAGDDELGRLGRSFDAMTRDLAESRDRLLESERVAAWREIGRRLAHEIKNPLSPIALSMETLRRSHAAGREDFPTYLEECTSTVLEEVDRLRRIVEEFSSFARLPPPQLIEESFHDVIRGVLALYAGHGREHQLSCALAEGEARFWFDPDQMNRLLINLVKNAIEATPAGGRIDIGTEVDRNGGWFRLWVADTGPGIELAAAASLFRPCESRKPGGSGLGLAIVYRIAAEHGGSVKLTNAGERGARFLVELPLKRAEPRAPSGP